MKELSRETVATVLRALNGEKCSLQGMLRSIENGKAAREKKEEFELRLSEIENAIKVFSEM